MPRKQDPDEESEEEGSVEVEVKPTKKRKSESKPESSKKTPKTAAKPEATKAGGADIGTKQVNDEGKPYMNLSEYKRVTINEFKGAKLVDIREVYKDKASGDMKPGKKGISLTLGQWKVLKSNIDSIDEMFGDE
ncbi:transcriptional Coactivator p15-domain-containing protein [Dioszegia hungarica]|uniref:Transcriptional Coactivator p15-domain-containing protein n=1 Tax=Dioszegia hungarica TaxID=4972 RepID=A0AA38LXF8_9TREE|nr:transcriptional Coactivator p15-domain-containing protein [Dioszegia hungarica]KAI9639642.1 transcriptional Coactivator p15-domain-containing protein [Dioszegia hungarica]